jgi:hypothetical protein
MSTITDTQLDALIEAARPNLRAAIRASVEQLSPIHFFEIAKVPLQSGQEWTLNIAVMLEPMSTLISGMILQGVPPMMQAYEKLKAPEPAKSGFSVPGA